MKLNKNILAAMSACVIGLSSGQAMAAGYSTSLYSTSGMANAYAGSATGSHDASDLFFNPAISAKFDKPQLIISASYLDLDIDADNVDARFDSGAQVTGTEVSDGGQDLFVPALYFSAPINDKMAFGLAISSPFGLATKYDQSSALRHRAVESSITTININPSISYKIQDNLSVGVGVSAQYYEASLTTVGRIAAPSAADYFTRTEGDDWGYGYNLGLDYQYNDDLEFGIGYRSKVDHKLEGTAGITFANTNTTIVAKGTTPESLTAGLKYQATDKTEIVYDTTWTRWSRLNKLVSTAVNTDLSSQTDFGWKDSMMYSLGLNHELNSSWLLRSGLAYETGATSDASREPRIPTGNRVWLTAGFNYKVTDSFSIDAAYVRQFHNREKISLPNDTNQNLGNDVSTLNYTSKTTVNVYSLGIKKEF